ncbi:unnamed protein product [Heterobilharzia americana]|nr:unnamed protein product [Heterobilharzia americana]
MLNIEFYLTKLLEKAVHFVITSPDPSLSDGAVIKVSSDHKNNCGDNDAYCNDPEDTLQPTTEFACKPVEENNNSTESNCRKIDGLNSTSECSLPEKSTEKKSLSYFEDNNIIVSSCEEIPNEEGEVDAILTLMEPKIVQKPFILSSLNYSQPNSTVMTTSNELSIEHSTDGGMESGWEDAWNLDT